MLKTTRTNELGEKVELTKQLDVKRVYTVRDFNGQIKQLQKFKDIVEEIK